MTEDELFIEDIDSVVSEIPVFLNDKAGDLLVALQYPTRRNGDTAETLAISVKQQSQVIETTLEPTVPSHCINQTPGQPRLTQKYSGVLNSTGPKFGIAQLKNNAMYISLVPRTGQLRPQFPVKENLLNPILSISNKPSEPLRSVQMSVKSTNQEVPKHSAALEFWRQAAKEKSSEYQIVENTFNSILTEQPPDEEVDAILTI